MPDEPADEEPAFDLTAALVAMNRRIREAITHTQEDTTP